MRVLVADDNLAFQSVLETMLISWGYAVTLARDGNEAGPRLARDLHDGATQIITRPAGAASMILATSLSARGPGGIQHVSEIL